MAIYRNRIVEERARKIAQFFKILLITGARQVGKSSLLSHLFPEVKSIVFDPVLDPYNIHQEPDRFLENFLPPLILDEIQYAPELVAALKRKVDTTETKGQYLVTGSQQLSILKTIAESLAGRVGIIELGPMTPQELYGNATESNWLERYLSDPHGFQKTVPNKLLHTPPLYETLWRGGMPGIIDMPLELIPTYFASYIQTYVERDVRMLDNIQDVALFGRFFSLLGALTAQEINYAQLGRDIGISPATAQRWLNILIHTYQWYEIWPYHGNTIKRISGKSKGFFSDSGLACHVQYITSPDALARSPALGGIFETFCFSMIRGLMNGLTAAPRIYHWRTAGGAEMDIILERDGKLYPIEIKCTTNPTKRHTRGMHALRQTYPEQSIMPGIMIYAGKECYWLDEMAMVVPWNCR